MDHLIELSQLKIAYTRLKLKRFLYHKIDWKWRLNGVIGARGTGKTTLLLQRLKEFHHNSRNAIYLTLDEFYFTENRLFTTIADLRKMGFRYFFLDEVHKYDGWARELKNIYDTYEDIFITFTGSSILEMTKQEVDLSRRAVIHYLPELSFREYLILSETITIEATTLDNLLKSHEEIFRTLPQNFRPLLHLKEYLKFGAFPFFKENKNAYHHRLLQVIKLIIESDLQFIEGYDPRNAKKIFQLLYVLAQNVPFKPNVSKLSEKIGVSRNTLIHYFHFLEKAALIHVLNYESQSVSALQKPDKILLRNPNLALTIAPDTTDVGSLRESFIVSQLRANHQVTIHRVADFLIDNKVALEVGGKNKSHKQIKALDDAYIVKDNIENGYQNTIPLWMFGLLY